MIKRRGLLAAIGGAVAGAGFWTPPGALGAEPREYPRPDPATFQPGDFVWPKKPGAYVPYNAGADRQLLDDQAKWTADRERAIDRLVRSKTLSTSEQQRLDLLRRMNFREFLAVYEGDQKPGVPGDYSSNGLYVGHVGIVDLDDAGKPWVIEAVIPEGVRRISYADWIRGRSDQVVWLGRIRDIQASQLRAIPVEAAKYLGKPYDFWNFDLDNDSGFYCSKLVWLSVFRSLGFAIDGNNDSKRAIWFSPKQLLYSPLINRLHDPGPYAYR